MIADSGSRRRLHGVTTLYLYHQCRSTTRADRRGGSENPDKFRAYDNFHGIDRLVRPTMKSRPTLRTALNAIRHVR